MGKNKILSMSELIKLTFILVIVFVLTTLKTFEDIPEAILKFTFPVSFMLMSYVVIGFIKIFYRVRKSLPINQNDNITTGLDNIFSLLIVVSLFFLILTFAGVSIIQFFTSISIVAAAIAIISKEYLSAIISGFIISFNDIINIGDYVQFNEQKGRIKDITLLKTYIESDQGELIIMNNDKAFFSDMINYSRSNRRRVNIKFEIGANAMTSIDEFEAELLELLKEYEKYIVEDSILLRIEELKADKILFILYYTISELEPNIEKQIRKQTSRKIVRYVQSNISPNVN